MKKYLLLLSFIFLISCTQTTLKDLRSQGEAETARLAHLLHEIDTKDELQQKLTKIEKSYNKIADLILQVRSLSVEASLSEPSKASDELFAELARLYEKPGCRSLLETAQQEAICRLKTDDTIF